MAERAIGELAIFYGDKENNGMYDNGVWMNVLDIPWITKIEEASLYKTVIHTMWLTAIGWHKEIRNRYPHVKLIGLSDHPLSTHISRMPASQQFSYLEDLQYLDGIMALTEEERQWYQVAVPSIPVEKVGLPFPTENYEKLFGKYRNSEKTIVGLGVGAADNDRNFVSNVLAFNKLQLNNPDLVGVFLSVPDQLLAQCSFWADRMENLFIQQRDGMENFYDMLSQCKFVINLADRNTPGRLQGECAFFGIPVIGSDRFELQNELWPDLAVKPFEIEKVVELGQFLINEPDHTNMIDYAYNTLTTEYGYEKSRERFNNLLNRMGGELN